MTPQSYQSHCPLPDLPPFLPTSLEATICGRKDFRQLETGKEKKRERETYSPIQSCPVRRAAAAPKMAAAVSCAHRVARGSSLGEGDIHLLPLSKGSSSAMGLLNSVVTLKILAQNQEAMCWSARPNMEI